MSGDGFSHSSLLVLDLIVRNRLLEAVELIVSSHAEDVRMYLISFHTGIRNLIWKDQSSEEPLVA